MQKLDKDSAPLLEGTVDLETGAIANTLDPELRTQALFRDRFIGVVRKGHWLSDGKPSPARHAAGRHIAISRQGLEMGPIEEAMSALGLERGIATTVGGLSPAVEMARASGLIASVPEPIWGIYVQECILSGFHLRLPSSPYCFFGIPGFTQIRRIDGYV